MYLGTVVEVDCSRVVIEAGGFAKYTCTITVGEGALDRSTQSSLLVKCEELAEFRIDFCE